MKALLVEDDYFYAARIREFLADRGIEVSVARTVQDALKTDLKDLGGAVLLRGLAERQLRPTNNSHFHADAEVTEPDFNDFPVHALRRI